MLLREQINIVINRHNGFIGLCDLLDFYKQYFPHLNYQEIAFFISNKLKSYYEPPYKNGSKNPDYKKVKYNIKDYIIPESQAFYAHELEERDGELLALALHYLIYDLPQDRIDFFSENTRAIDYIDSYGDIYLNIEEIKSLLGEPFLTFLNDESSGFISKNIGKENTTAEQIDEIERLTQLLIDLQGCKRKVFSIEDVKEDFISLYSLIEIAKHGTELNYNEIGRLLKVTFYSKQVGIYSHNHILNNYSLLNDQTIGNENALSYYIEHLISNNGYEHESDYIEEESTIRARIYEDIFPFEGHISCTPSKEFFKQIYVKTDEIKSLNENHESNVGENNCIANLQAENEALKQRIAELEAQLEAKENQVSTIVNYDDFSIYGHTTESIKAIFGTVNKFWINVDYSQPDTIVNAGEIEEWITSNYSVSGNIGTAIQKITRPEQARTIGSKGNNKKG